VGRVFARRFGHRRHASRRDLADAADVILANVEFISDRPLGEDAPARTRKRNDKSKAGRLM